MIITFVLPGHGRHPIGGYKVVYQYANTLVGRGHKVNVVHPAMIQEEKRYSKLSFFRKTWSRYWSGLYRKDWLPANWFLMDSRVEMLWTPCLAEADVPDADVVIATHWATAEYVACYSRSKGRKYYLIQHYEVWSGSEERVRATWRLPLHKLVIARWLQDIANELGETCDYVPNGLDFSLFGCDIPIEEKWAKNIAMLSHDQDWKGTREGVEALIALRLEFPDIKVSLFGTGSRPTYVPAWIDYFQNPEQALLRDIYNKAAIFVAPSWAEGWPLPPAEAMMTAAAVVGTDIGGHREYMRDEDTALLSPPQRSDLLAINLKRMLVDDTLRQAIAHSGYHNIQQFTWDSATNRLEQVIAKENSLAALEHSS